MEEIDLRSNWYRVFVVGDEGEMFEVVMRADLIIRSMLRLPPPESNENRVVVPPDKLEWYKGMTIVKAFVDITQPLEVIYPKEDE